MQTAPKVVGGTVGSVTGGAISVVALYLAGQYLKFTPPPEVASAITLLISGLTAYIGGWFAPHSKSQGAPPTP